VRRRRFSALDSQRLIERVLNTIRYVQRDVLPGTQHRIAQSRELLSRSTGSELPPTQRAMDPDDGQHRSGAEGAEDAS
jgi:hypothetical protein